jgi:HAD superfamily hydrolase (TIGR01458 family)
VAIANRNRIGDSIEGVLCDLDGTLYVGDDPIAGAADAIAYLRERGLALRFLTNSTTRSRKSLAAHVQALGFGIGEEEIYSAAYAGVLYLRSLGRPRCRFILQDDARTDYREFPQDDDSPEIIVVGDIGPSWDYPLMNSIFRQVLGGARIVALHRNRYYRTSDGLDLDSGTFVAALEYATGTSAHVTGKPSGDFFSRALNDFRIPPANVIIIGDDIESDIGGAKASGIRGVLVKTGKFRQELVDRSSIHPDFVIDSIKSVSDLW